MMSVMVHKETTNSRGSPDGNYSIGLLVSHALPLRRGVFVLHVFYIGWLHDSTLPHRRGDVVTGGQCCGRPSDVAESTHMHCVSNACTRSYKCAYIA